MLSCQINRAFLSQALRQSLKSRLPALQRSIQNASKAERPYQQPVTEQNQSGADFSFFGRETPEYRFKSLNKFRSANPTTNGNSSTGKLIILSSDELSRLASGSPDPAQVAVVNRASFIQDYNHVTSLLEACIESNELERAKMVLSKAHAMLKPEGFMKAQNSFLTGLARSNQGDIKPVLDWVDNLSSRFSNISPDDSTYAILLAAICEIPDVKLQEPLIKRYVSEWRDGTENKRRDIGEVLRHKEVIGTENIKHIVSVCRITSEELSPDLKEQLTKLVPEQKTYQSIFIDTKNKLNRIIDPSDMPSQVENSVDSLVPVNTVGLKIIKSTLLAIESGNRPDIPKQLKDRVGELFNGKQINFLELSKHIDALPSEEAEMFTNALEYYNEQRQVGLERYALAGARDRWKYDFQQRTERGEVIINDKLNPILWRWHSALNAAIQEELNKVDQALSSTVRQTKDYNERLVYGPFLKLIDPELLSVITILETLKLHSTGTVSEGMRTARAVMSVGQAVEMEYQANQLLKQSNDLLNGFKPSKADFTNRQSFNRLINNAKRNTQNDDNKTRLLMADWPYDIKAKMGSILISILMHVAKVPVKAADPITGRTVTGEAPAFYHTYQYQKGNKLGILKIHKVVVDLLANEDVQGTVNPQHLPMLVKPRPWTSYRDGAYNYTPSMLMRIKDSPEQLAYLKEASNLGVIDDVYRGLDVLGNSAWTVNRGILDVMANVWNSGEAYLDIPGRIIGDVELPPKPDTAAEPQVKRDWARQCKHLLNLRQSLHSQRCDINYKLEIARAYVGERMYFPHNIDFRGRAYPIPPHFNHLGNDMCRSLLVFWEGRQLGEIGLKWLKIHLANLFGLSKSSFKERVEFTDAHMDDVKSSANDPLGKGKWWADADDPWQALSTCFEIAEAMKLDDPTKFISHLPIHQDGTCNGLQHYAALGGDVEGAQQVNLLARERPGDVYIHVASMVVKAVEEDAAKGIEPAMIMLGKVTRKVVKQTVMTNVYGVTFVGARSQVMSQLKHVPDIPDEKIYLCASYIAKHILLSVRKLFSGAHLIQDWLDECAKIISKSLLVHEDGRIDSDGHLSSVVWTTPLGLPIAQPYRSTVRKQVGTKLQTVFLSDPYAINPVNSRKQASAFPPNYIHSLDATHMLLSAIACGEKGLTFAAVHDSYWTHAADGDVMAAALRNAFVQLHEDNLIAKLKTEFEDRYRRHVMNVAVRVDEPVGQEIIALRKELETKIRNENPDEDWDSVISLLREKPTTLKDKRRKSSSRANGLKIELEVLKRSLDLDRERLVLLRSNDPEDVIRGKAMVTEASILEKHDVAVFSKPKQRTSLRLRFRSNENENNFLERAALSDLEGEEQDVDSHLEAADELEETDETFDEELPEEIDEPVVVAKAQKKKRGAGSKSLNVFVPLVFPDIPPKGNLDVKSVLESQYFFS